MTGFGAASRTERFLSVQIELRSVNNRHLKLSVRGTAPYPLLEAELEKVVRKRVKRGSVMVQIRVQRGSPQPQALLNTSLLEGYLNQLTQLQGSWPANWGPHLATGLLALPGVAEDSLASMTPPEQEWPVVEEVLEDALVSLNQSRQTEGAAMAEELNKLQQRLTADLTTIEATLPDSLSDYRQRLWDRIQPVIAEAKIALKPEDLIRELALYADRTDVSEELTRLKSHLVQFEELIKKPSEGAGRRLEFVVQEMGREINTTGSKAGSASISRQVIEMKATLEKIRELIQNVE